MTDRELLELAARHAGRAFTVGRDWHDVGQIYVDGRAWDALADDGDAFRLMVKLGLGVLQDKFYASVYDSTGEEPLAVERAEADRAAAARRAIVRAAAALAA